MSLPDQPPVDLVKPTPRPPAFPRQLWRPALVLRITLGLTVVGVLVGALWALLAPRVHGVVALARDSDERFHLYLGNDGDQFFVAAAMMIGLLSVVGVVTGVLLWQRQAERGPAMVVAGVIGSVTAALAATGVGALLVRLRYGVVDVAAAPVTPDDRFYYVTQAPGVFFAHTPLTIAATLLAGAAAFSGVYVLLAASTSRDDLGGDPPMDVAPVPWVVPEGPARPIAGDA